MVLGYTGGGSDGVPGIMSESCVSGTGGPPATHGFQGIWMPGLYWGCGAGGGTGGGPGGPGKVGG